MTGPKTCVEIEVESENGERRYLRVHPQVPVPDPMTSGTVLLQTEVWGGPCDGVLQLVQVYQQAAHEILASIGSG
jgi:hypothetical protein